MAFVLGAESLYNDAFSPAAARPPTAGPMGATRINPARQKRVPSCGLIAGGRFTGTINDWY
jgi:hypothetical protein